MKMKLQVLFYCFFSSFVFCGGSNILVVLPIIAKSHGALFDRLVEALLERGHSVTYASSLSKDGDVQNLTKIALPSFMPDEEKKEIPVELMLKYRQIAGVATLLTQPFFSAYVCDQLLQLPEIVKLIKGDDHFDLIIGGTAMADSFLAGFSHKNNAPIVTLHTLMPNVWANYWVGNPYPSSYIPDPFTSHPSKMTFLQRLHNFIFTTCHEFVHQWMYMFAQNRVMKKHFGDHLPHVTTIVKNTSLVLVNHHNSVAFPRAYLPNMVEIGGFHVRPPKKLPQDFQTFLDESKDGAILFSLGSIMKSSLIPKDKIEGILEAISKLKQNVIWKFETDDLPNKPKNLRIYKWLPQTDILAHPNLKLFITHGGLLSILEAVTRGVPVVGIPVLSDQPANMKHVETIGFGVTLEYDEINNETFYNAATQVLNNPRFSEIAKERSKLLQDRPLSAIDTAMFWIEHVIRHKGAPHLKSPGQDLSWYEFYQLDVALVIVSGVATTFYLLFKIVKLLVRRFRRSNRDTAKKNN